MNADILRSESVKLAIPATERPHSVVCSAVVPFAEAARSHVDAMRL